MAQAAALRLDLRDAREKTGPGLASALDDALDYGDGVGSVGVDDDDVTALAGRSGPRSPWSGANAHGVSGAAHRWRRWR
jgi:hypothetical protein